MSIDQARSKKSAKKCQKLIAEFQNWICKLMTTPTKILIGILFLAGLFGMLPINHAEASRVKGYYKPSTGTYVQPYYRSSPNSTKWDNYSTRGNYNPYTGKRGYTNPYKSNYRYYR